MRNGNYAISTGFYNITLHFQTKIPCAVFIIVSTKLTVWTKSIFTKMLLAFFPLINPHLWSWLRIREVCYFCDKTKNVIIPVCLVTPLWHLNKIFQKLSRKTGDRWQICSRQTGSHVWQARGPQTVIKKGKNGICVSTYTVLTQVNIVNSMLNGCRQALRQLVDSHRMHLLVWKHLVWSQPSCMTSCR